jgi:hypothetical protein
MGCTRIKENDNQVTIEGKFTCEYMSALVNILPGGVIHSTSLGSNNSRRIVGMNVKSWRINLPRCHTLLGEMTNMTIVVAGTGSYTQVL